MLRMKGEGGLHSMKEELFIVKLVQKYERVNWKVRRNILKIPYSLCVVVVMYLWVQVRFPIGQPA